MDHFIHQKENVIKEQTKLEGREVTEHSTHAGPAEYFPSLEPNKIAPANAAHPPTE